MPTVKRAAGAGGGEIVQVQGGHIIRATGRKDRHSKVYTAKGPRDRRVRLAAHTAIQFYDVQDRLGYDRPSKAVDWLIDKAKYAIDKLAQLPPFDPSSLDSNALEPNGDLGAADLAAAGGGDQSESSGYEIQLHGHHQAPPAGLDSQSFFPTTTTDNSMGFEGYPHQDLCLSLQSFQNAGFIHGGESETGNPNNSDHSVFPAGFGGGGGGWSNPEEMGRFSRLLAWHGGGGVGEGYDVGGARGTLQSSFHSPASIRAWSDLPMEQEGGIRQPSMAGIGIHGSDGFGGFCAPPQIHGGVGQNVAGTVSQHHQQRSSSMSTDSSH